MPSTRQTLSVPTAIFLLLSLIGLSGCANAVIGVGTAAVAASYANSCQTNRPVHPKRFHSDYGC